MQRAGAKAMFSVTRHICLCKITHTIIHVSSDFKMPKLCVHLKNNLKQALRALKCASGIRGFLWLQILSFKKSKNVYIQICIWKED